MKRPSIIAGIVTLLFASCCGGGCPTVQNLSEEEFANPPMKYRPVPLWFWNDTEVSAEGVAFQLRRMVEKDGYGGCAILPFGRGFRPGYLGEEYMRIYSRAVELADSLGAQMSLYDEYGFPSGSMGFSNADGVPRFRNAHPGKTIKRLDKHETKVMCGESVELDLTGLEGKLMAVAAYDSRGLEARSLRSFINEGKLVWTAPEEGCWRVMVFECVEDGKPRVDYLDPEAVGLFIQDTHEKYRAAFGDRFSSVVTSTFFDEPTMYYAQGRMWTERFNEEFRARYGMEPDAFYPALWYEVGERTASIRNMMYGLHSALYVEGFTKTVAEWAESHGIASTGHQDQEEIANTTGVSGDLMLHGKYMTMPGIDKIGGDRPAELFYKVVSSSANNWDKTEVMSETFGAMGNIPVGEMYRIAIEQYSKGITNLIPHAVWYDDSKVTFPPELSWRNPLYNGELPAFNGFLARMRYLFARPGRHVADIALLYPVQTQYAGHRLDGELGPVRGGVEVEGTDYPEVSRILTDELGRDFTYIHPEVLDSRCSISGGRLNMKNRINGEQFSVLILPGVKTISLSNMKQVWKAWKSGVRIIFTTQTPCESADFDVDNRVIAQMTGRMLSCRRKGRSAVFVPSPTSSSIAGALKGIDCDVEFLSEGQPFNYLHKVISSGNGETGLYLIGNIDSEARSQEISLRGEYAELRILDPHTGVCSPASFRISNGRTQISLSLAPGESRVIAASGKPRPSRSPKGLADCVDTRIGVIDQRGSNCVIGPMLPYGSINPSPQTFGGDTDGYSPGQPIDGFAQLHVSGTGWSSYGHFLIQPQTGAPSVAPGTHASAHSDDVTLPYLYATTLDRYGIRVEVAPSHYSAAYRFTFPESGCSSIVFDASQSIARDIATYMGGKLLGNEVYVDPDGAGVRMMISISAGWPEGPYKLYATARLNKKISGYGVWEGDEMTEGGTSLVCDTLSSTHKGAYFTFPTKEGESVILKTAISFTGFEKAEELLASEIPGWNFDKVARKGRRAWNRKLKAIGISGVSDKEKTIFYSALYRVFTFARERSLDNGKWESEYPFWDDNYAYWDTFRTLFPLLVLIDGEAVAGNILSMTDRFEHNGCVYDGFIAGKERFMEQGGNDVDCIIADACLKGVKGVDWEKAYAIVRHNAEKRRIGYGNGDPDECGPHTRYRELGFIPSCNMSSSQTLEFAYNDYCAGLMAKRLGHDDDAEKYLTRSHGWTALWNPDLSDGTYSGFIDAVDENGVFSFIDPSRYGGSWISPFYEGSSWTYSYFVPHDFDRIITLMGGPEAFTQRLQYGFENKLVKYDNEPGFLASRAFVHSGRPDLSSYWVHHSMSNGFDLEGYPGNEDTGAMASWFIFCNLGLCPNAGQDFYYLNAPLVSDALVRLPGGSKLRIRANASKENVYIKSLKVNGKPWNSAILPHSEIASGGSLEFELDSEPSDFGMN